MRALVLATALLISAVPSTGFAQGAPKFSTSTSTINQLLADPAAKAVVEKHMPQIAQAAGQVGDQTLKALQAMAGDRVPDKLLADIDADLVKIK